MRRERAQIARPPVDRAPADVRLRQMIQHEALPREPRRELAGNAQMATIYEDVVREVELFEARKAGDERRAHEKAVVGLGLRDMTDANELRMPRHGLEIRTHADRLQIDPADDARDERMRVGEREQPARLLGGLPRLHGDARREAGALNRGREILGQKIAAQCRHRVIDPSVLRGVVAPEVLVRVDSRGRVRRHESWISTTSGQTRR